MKTFALVLTVAFGLSAQAHATISVPTCLDDSKQVLQINNEQVIEWKHTSANEFHSRGHVQGTITKLYKDATGHHHFEATITGTSTSDTVELVYDLEYGATAALQVGQSVEACGDYITSYAAADGYQPSPDGALIHWMHASDEASHPAGFLIVDGTLYGQ